MNHSIKIKSLQAPDSDLTKFDPGAYLAELEFYETDEPITDQDRDGLAQFIHFLAFLALKSQSDRWRASVVPYGSSAFLAIGSHFSHLPGWDAVSRGNENIFYSDLASFLMSHIPPRLPGS